MYAAMQNNLAVSICQLLYQTLILSVVGLTLSRYKEPITKLMNTISNGDENYSQKCNVDHQSSPTA